MSYYKGEESQLRRKGCRLRQPPPPPQASASGVYQKINRLDEQSGRIPCSSSNPQILKAAGVAANCNGNDVPICTQPTEKVAPQKKGEQTDKVFLEKINHLDLKESEHQQQPSASPQKSSNCNPESGSGNHKSTNKSPERGGISSSSPGGYPIKTTNPESSKPYDPSIRQSSKPSPNEEVGKLIKPVSEETSDQQVVYDEPVLAFPYLDQREWYPSDGYRSLPIPKQAQRQREPNGYPPPRSLPIPKQAQRQREPLPVPDGYPPPRSPTPLFKLEPPIVQPSSTGSSGCIIS
ncbi:hypothetical protein COLO4_36777 [Corchorus olitorius]|uniref:Uncharacterized protein n=1 Tax=Corchorus olitorius TaxID=93759 RepID=A0A1R3G5G5_9ROSI|nr:hypothetical protein COLO4_36777 [Corchorus olitorius]